MQMCYEVLCLSQSGAMKCSDLPFRSAFAAEKLLKNAFGPKFSLCEPAITAICDKIVLLACISVSLQLVYQATRPNMVK
jgi:hypothetical protein